MRITEQEFLEWKQHPVTEAFFSVLDSYRLELVDIIESKEQPINNEEFMTLQRGIYTRMAVLRAIKDINYQELERYLVD